MQINVLHYDSAITHHLLDYLMSGECDPENVYHAATLGTHDPGGLRDYVSTYCDPVSAVLDIASDLHDARTVTPGEKIAVHLMLAALRTIDWLALKKEITSTGEVGFIARLRQPA